MSCVECSNQTVQYSVDWAVAVSGERRRRDVNNNGNKTFILRWGSVIKYKDTDLVPLEAELGRVQAVSFSSIIQLSLFAKIEALHLQCQI